MEKKPKKEHTDVYDQIMVNIRKIMNDNGLIQANIAEMMGASESSASKIFTGKASLTIDHLANLARSLAVSINDIITYSDAPINNSSEPVEAVLQIKLKKEKKDQVLRLVFGENNMEILNK